MYSFRILHDRFQDELDLILHHARHPTDDHHHDVYVASVSRNWAAIRLQQKIGALKKVGVLNSQVKNIV